MWVGAGSAFLAFFLGTAACTSDGPNPITWRYSFDRAADEQAARGMVGAILEGGCDSGNDVLFSVTWPADGAPDGVPPPQLESGTYGFVVVALDATCHIIARDCDSVDVPQDTDPIEMGLDEVSAGPLVCDTALDCVDGLCAGEPNI